MSPGVGAAICFVLGCYAGRFALRCADRFALAATPPPPEDITGPLAWFREEVLFSLRWARDQWAEAVRIVPADRAFRPWHQLPLVGRWLPRQPIRCGPFGDELARWAVEVLGAVLFAAVAWRDLSGDVAADAEALRASIPGGPTAHAAMLAGHLVMTWAILVAIVTDLRTMFIDDGCTVAPALFAVVWAGLTGCQIVVPVWYSDPAFTALLTGGGLPVGGLYVPAWIAGWPHVHGLVASIAGMLGGAAVTGVVLVVGRWGLRKEALGFGDVLMLAMIGAFLGWQAAAVVFFLAPFFSLGYLALTRTFQLDKHFAFGPGIAAGAMALLLGWPAVWPPAERYFQMGLVLFAFAGVMTALFAGLLVVTRVAKSLLLGPEPPEPVRGRTARPAALSDWGRPSTPHEIASGGRRTEQTWRGDI